MFKPIGVAVLSCLSFASVHAELTYRIYPLGDLDEGKEATGLNDRGGVVGEATIDGKSRAAVVWNEGIVTQIPLGADQMEGANGINDAGTVVGMVVQNDFTQHAYAWNGKSVTLLPGADAQANVINNRGEIAGYSTVNGLQLATIWNDGRATVLDVPGAIQSSVNGINNHGDVVGEYTDGTSTHAFLDHDGKISELASAGGSFDDAFAINDQGQILGIASSAGTANTHTVLWQNGAIQAATSGENERISPYSLNDSDSSVGSVAGDPTVWNDGVPTELSSLLPDNSGWTLKSAEDINNRGQIIGVGVFKHQTETFIMTPSTEAVPLPSPLLIGLATFPLAVFASLRSRCKRAGAR